MAEQKRLFLLAAIMVALCLVGVGITTDFLYRNTMNDNRARLRETAESQARLIEAMARFDARWSNDYPEGSISATLLQVTDAHKHYVGFGETGEFTLARREGDWIVFVLRHRPTFVGQPDRILFDSARAEPMRRALNGYSGSVIAQDYRGKTVLAGYEPVGELDLGIVAKIDLAEIRAPFIRASQLASSVIALLILISLFLFRKVSKPIIKKQLELEAHLRQQQKLESIGTLAGGVAHEINNPINGIMNYARLISERLDPDSPLREYADGIGQETERVAKIVRNLLTFARYDEESHSSARIVDIVNDTISLILTIIRKDQITLHVDVPEDLPEIKCRSQQMQQVLLNLLTNARDALNARYPEHDPDKIMTVTVRPFEKEGQCWIRVTVEDHGIGIADDIREHLFDPFFTTKDRTKGTGLGLSISHSIIQDHRGQLSVECEARQYTRFHFELPVDNGWSVDKAPEKMMQGV